MVYPFNAPLLDFLILSIIRRQDSYGYLISQQLKNVSNMKDSTLYPILKRLSDNEFVETYDQPFQGRNRKYYRITKSGCLQCDFLYQEWKLYSQAIEDVISGKNVSPAGETSSSQASGSGTDSLNEPPVRKGADEEHE